METNNLGLPFEYQQLPEFFDAKNIQPDTAAKNSRIETLLKKYNIKSVLDLTCGTGSQVFYLAEHGYQVTGADFSPELLRIARKKATAQNVIVQFIDGDMRTLQVGQFDAIITIFNAVGHVTRDGFEQTLQNIHRNLNPGGIYIFDILNLQAMADANVAQLACYTHKKVDDTQILATQCSTIDRTEGVLTSYNNVMIQRNAQKPEQFQQEFSLQIYTAQELQTMLKQKGFETLEQTTFDGTPFSPDNSVTILTVARKK